MVWEIPEAMRAMRKVFYYHSLLEKKGLFSRKISIDYKVGSYDSWLHFNHPSDEDLSFRIHSLEFGKERQGEAAFLHTAVQRGKDVIFEGFINQLHFLGFKRIRGYLEVPSEYYKLGIVVNNGRVNELITTQEMFEMSSKLFIPLFFLIHQGYKRKTLVDKI